MNTTTTTKKNTIYKCGNAKFYDSYNSIKSKLYSLMNKAFLRIVKKLDHFIITTIIIIF